MTLRYAPFRASDRIVKAAQSAPWMNWGENNGGVSILQGALIDLGYGMPISTRKKGEPDGIYGDETYGVVLRFQGDQKLHGKDGLAGRETIGRLDHLLFAKAKPVVPLPPMPVPPLAPPADNHYTIGTADPTVHHDPGAGPWNSKPSEYTYIALKSAIISTLPPASNIALLATGPNACRHMWHYLLNSGNRYTIDLEDMITSGPVATARFRDEISQAQAFVEKLPVGVHRITSKSAESAYNRKEHSRDWYFAIGGYSTWGKGTATVRSGASGLEYELRFEYKFEDKYNWDGGKSVTLGGITITDHFMGEFHRQGLAKEFICVGSIPRTFRWQAGGAIPEQQYARGGR